ncbi:hypothetical protein NKI01_18285 [Mesorhizobium sp. M0815]
MRPKEMPRVEIGCPDAHSNFVDTFASSSLFNMAHQSCGNSTTTSFRHNRDVVHLDQGPRESERRFWQRLNFKPDVADWSTINLSNRDRALRISQPRCEECPHRRRIGCLFENVWMQFSMETLNHLIEPNERVKVCLRGSPDFH